MNANLIAISMSFIGAILILIGFIVGRTITVLKKDMEQVWEYIYCGRVDPYKYKKVPNGNLIILGTVLIIISLFIFIK